MRQLEKTIDSLEKENDLFKELSLRDNFRTYRFPAYLDSAWDDKISPASQEVKKFDELLPDSAIATLNQSAKNMAGSIRLSAESMDIMLKAKDKNIRAHKIEWHRKIVLSLACLVLFLIGAPLGSIIRKGGLGSPLVFAIAFFMVFYFASNTGEKSARVYKLTPFTGMWLAIFILVPIGVFLTYKATRDSQLFNKEWYNRYFIKK
jgi:lipopolysaccharide export system permease protein